MGDETYEAPPHGWTCFHCGETFAPDLAGQRAARDHFGATPDAEAACRIKAGKERRLVQALRRSQAEVSRLLSVIQNEDSGTDRAMRRMQADHAVALRREEERGYARGLEDARSELGAEIERLNRLINTPETADWLRGVQLEAAHQIERWRHADRAGKTPADWFWLLGYLAGKALASAIAGDIEKLLHHTISSGAVLLNWHRYATGENTSFRPGAPNVQQLAGDTAT